MTMNKTRKVIAALAAAGEVRLITIAVTPVRSAVLRLVVGSALGTATTRSRTMRLRSSRSAESNISVRRTAFSLKWVRRAVRAQARATASTYGARVDIVMMLAPPLPMTSGNPMVTSSIAGAMAATTARATRAGRRREVA
ncbi:hypothetical protein [Janibacter melonis]|uniref:hypothetical protein n=1 Tax=Janibacter melonis TaxID=262209 RepID=UPI00177E5B85|nr:hypothetical protein [Janibacter melonis]